MTCSYFVPQINTVSNTWVDVSEPYDTYEKANEKRADYYGNARVLGFRVLQVSCAERQRFVKTCCGK